MCSSQWRKQRWKEKVTAMVRSVMWPSFYLQKRASITKWEGVSERNRANRFVTYLAGPPCVFSLSERETSYKAICHLTSYTAIGCVNQQVRQKCFLCFLSTQGKKHKSSCIFFPNHSLARLLEWTWLTDILDVNVWSMSAYFWDIKDWRKEGVAWSVLPLHLRKGSSVWKPTQVIYNCECKMHQLLCCCFKWIQLSTAKSKKLLPKNMILISNCNDSSVQTTGN